MLLMMFSNFYKQRIMPNEIYEFFVNSNTDIEEIEIDQNIDYLKVYFPPLSILHLLI